MNETKENIGFKIWVDIDHTKGMNGDKMDTID
jgi:hypothetical protein